MNKKNQSGFSMIEMLVGIGLGAIVCSVAFYLMYFFNLNYTTIQNKIEAERTLIQAVYNLQRVLSLAVHVTNTSSIPSGTAIGSTSPGLIADYNATTMGTPGSTDIVAAFLREKGGYQATPQGEYSPVAIFYTRPTPTKTGVIFLNVNNNAAKSPSWNDVFFERVVEFSLTNFLYSPTATPVLTSAELSITMRNFLDPYVAKWNFCPQTDKNNGVTGCNPANAATYRDLNRKIRITFSNQTILSNSPSTPPSPSSPYERTFGQLYLFPTQF